MCHDNISSDLKFYYVNTQYRLSRDEISEVALVLFEKF